jgi:hypothetical protein
MFCQAGENLFLDGILHKVGFDAPANWCYNRTSIFRLNLPFGTEVPNPCSSFDPFIYVAYLMGARGKTKDLIPICVE